MTNTPITLQDLRKRICIKSKAEPAWRFWGLCVHVCKLETLREAYAMAKSNNGAPGIDGVTFAAIEQSGAEEFLLQIRNELVEFRYLPLAVRKKEMPKADGKMRVLSIPAIRDRVVQGALKLILESVRSVRCGGDWKPVHSRAIEALPEETGSNRQAGPTEHGASPRPYRSIITKNCCAPL